MQGSELELAGYTEADPPPGTLVEEIEPGWEERWRDFHRPVRVGPFWIGPPWQPQPSGVTPLVIDPGRAFGTGAHATTQLCLALVADQSPVSLLDAGCGSGVIAIAAALLGFSPVVAFDVDPAAVEATARNAALNGVPVDVRQLDLTTDPLPTAAVATANISLELVEALLARTDALLAIVSGYLEQDDPKLGAFRRRERRVRDGWAADLLERAE